MNRADMEQIFYTNKARAQGFCPACGSDNQISRRTLNHQTQLILTIVTLGLWAIPWLALWLYGKRIPWRCRCCREVVPRLAHAKNRAE